MACPTHVPLYSPLPWLKPSESLHSAGDMLWPEESSVPVYRVGWECQPGGRPGGAPLSQPSSLALRVAEVRSGLPCLAESLQQELPVAVPAYALYALWG